MGIVRPDSCVEPLDLESAGYDVIGDVHGCHDQLIELLIALGYSDTAGAYRHPTRQAIFVGDLIDRGPQQVEVLRTVRAMTDAGSAQVIMGNHEFNAVCWYTPHRNKPGAFLRPHNEKNANQHAEFLRQIGPGSDDHNEAVKWFATLPLWLDLEDLRVVHACWDSQAMAGLGKAHLENEDFHEASERDSDPYIWVENLCKGPEVQLPHGHHFIDKDGHRRDRARFRWWDAGENTYDVACEVPNGVTLPNLTIEDPPVSGYEHNVPVLFGHYWRRWPHHDLTDRTACIDYSAVKGGPLVAYRWSGEKMLDLSNLVGCLT